MEVYGGPLLNSWLDREFGLAGRVVTRDGAVHLVSTPAWLRIPQVAPHLDRSVNDSLHLDRQSHLKPIFGTASVDLLSAVAGALGRHRDEIDGHEDVYKRQVLSIAIKELGVASMTARSAAYSRSAGN